MKQLAFSPASMPHDPVPPAQIEVPPPVILQYWGLARHYLWLILAIIAATVVVGIVLTLLVTPRYTATARIEIQREQDNVTKVEGLQSARDGQSQEFYQTQYSLLNARSLAERVARRLRLAQDEVFVREQGWGGTLFEDKNPSSAELHRREEGAITALLKNVVIAPVRGSALIDLSYVSTSPPLSERIANSWVTEFVSQSMDRRFASTADARHFLEQRLQALRERLERSERDLVGYAQQRNIVRLNETRSPDGRTDTTQTLLGSDIEALNTELVTATARRVEAEGQMDAARGGASTADTIGNAAVNVLRASRAQKASDYADLIERFEPAYLPARALKQQIVTLDQSIAKEEQRVAGASTTAYDAARQRETMLRARLEVLLAKLDSQNQATIQYNIYQRDVDTNRQLYDGLLQRYKEIGVAGVGMNTIAIVDPAVMPTARSSPKLMLNLALALMAGLLFAGMTVFVLENLDEGLRTQQQVTEELGIALLGTIPHALEGDPLALVEDPKSVLSEAYMTLRTNLSFSTDHGFPRSVTITSSVPAEGKSTTSYALARLLARTGKKVLLVDMDLRRPRLAKLLALDATRGVAHYLAGDDDWRGMVQDTGATNLFVLPAGPIPPSAAELLTGARFSHLVEQALSEFDHVVFDGPPLLGIADAVLIAKPVEGVVLVIEADRVPVRAIRASVARLRLANARILGAALTRYRGGRARYGSGYDYDYHYSYGAGDRDTVC